MAKSPSTPPSFGKALRLARIASGLPQEHFDTVSSRTYISTLERGLKQPTIAKVTELAGVLGLHPLTLLVLAYAKPNAPAALALLDEVKTEVRTLLEGMDERSEHSP